MLTRLISYVAAGCLLGGCAMKTPRNGVDEPSERSGMASYPTPISNNAVASVVSDDGPWVIYSMMGIVDPNDPETITTAAYRLEHDAAGWERIADVPGIGDRGLGKIGASAAAVGGELYLVGGYAVVDDRTEVTETRLLRYDADQDTWRDLGPVPREVDDTLMAVWHDRWIVLVSGWHGPIHDNVRDIQFYDTQTETWTAATPLPGPGVFGHTGGISGDTLVVSDGVTTEGGYAITARTYVGSLDRERVGVIEWQPVMTHGGMATYRAASNATVTQTGDLVVVGGTHNPYNISGVGYNGIESEPLNQMLRFDPSAGSWTHTEIDQVVMDLRGLAWIGGDRWAIVGGMTSAGVASDRIQVLELPGTTR